MFMHSFIFQLKKKMYLVLFFDKILFLGFWKDNTMSIAIKLPILTGCVLMAITLVAKEYIIEAPDGVGDVVALTNAFAELNKANTTGAKILLKPGL